MAKKKVPPSSPCEGECERAELLRDLRSRRAYQQSIMRKARKCIAELVAHVGEENLPATLRRDAERQITALQDSFEQLAKQATTGDHSKD